MRSRKMDLVEAVGLIKSLIKVNSSQYGHFYKKMLQYQEELDKLNEEENKDKDQEEKKETDTKDTGE